MALNWPPLGNRPSRVHQRFATPSRVDSTNPLKYLECLNLMLTCRPFLYRPFGRLRRFVFVAPISSTAQSTIPVWPRKIQDGPRDWSPSCSSAALFSSVFLSLSLLLRTLAKTERLRARYGPHCSTSPPRAITSRK
jgi:hypothetical protein